MSIDRSALEQEALEAVSAELYYELCDNIGEMSERELLDIVNGHTRNE